MRITNEGLAVIAAALSVRADHPSQSRRRSTPAARHGARARRTQAVEHAILLPRRRLLRRQDGPREG